MQLHIDYWKQEGLPVIQVGCDYDTKNLNYIEYIGLSGNRIRNAALELNLSGWILHPIISDHAWPLNINGDPKHGIKLGRAQILYVDKLIPSPAGPLLLQYFEDARHTMSSGLTKKSVDPNDRQDVEESMAFLAEPARRIIYRDSGNLAIAVYTFVSRYLYDIYCSLHPLLFVKRKVFLAGVIERLALGWRIWILDSKQYCFSRNFWSSQYLKFMVLQPQSYVTRILIQKLYFDEFPFYTAADGSDHCEHFFQKLKQKHGTYSTKEMCDETCIIAGEQKLLSVVHEIKDTKHLPFSASRNCVSYPLGKELPSKDYIEKLFEQGRKYGDILLDWLGMKQLLQLSNHWQHPLMPKWKSLDKKNHKNNNEIQNDEDEGEEEDEEDDEVDEEQWESEDGVISNDDANLLIAEELDKIAKHAIKLDTGEVSDDEEYIVFPEELEEKEADEDTDEEGSSVETYSVSAEEISCKEKPSIFNSLPLCPLPNYDSIINEEVSEIWNHLKNKSVEQSLELIKEKICFFKESHQIPSFGYRNLILEILNTSNCTADIYNEIFSLAQEI